MNNIFIIINNIFILIINNIFYNREKYQKTSAK